MREEMTSDEWAAFIAGSVAYFNSHLRDFGNVDDMFGYIRTQMRWMFPELQGVRWGVWPDVLAESQYSQIIIWFIALPDAVDYGYHA